MNTPYVFKKCTKCGKWLVASTVNFYKNKDGKYGLKSVCKECDKVRSKKYYEQNKEEKGEYDKKYREGHKEEIAKRNKKYYQANKEYILKRCRKYREENKEEVLKRQRKYSETPQGQVVTFNGNNKRRQRTEQQGNGITKEQWLEMMKYFDFKCAYSGKSISIKENRSIDHIFPLAKGGAHEIWNCVPMDRSLNSSKCDSNIEQWYPQQDFYNENNLNKIKEWCKYSYNK